MYQESWRKSIAKSMMYFCDFPSDFFGSTLSPSFNHFPFQKKTCRFPRLQICPLYIFGNYPPQMVKGDQNIGFDSGPNLQPKSSVGLIEEKSVKAQLCTCQDLGLQGVWEVHRDFVTGGGLRLAWGGGKMLLVVSKTLYRGCR